MSIGMQRVCAFLGFITTHQPQRLSPSEMTTTHGCSLEAGRWSSTRKPRRARHSTCSPTESLHAVILIVMDDRSSVCDQTTKLVLVVWSQTPGLAAAVSLGWERGALRKKCRGPVSCSGSSSAFSWLLRLMIPTHVQSRELLKLKSAMRWRSCFCHSCWSRTAVSARVCFARSC